MTAPAEWAAIVRSAPVGILIGDADGLVEYANPAAEKRLGAVWQGRLVSDLLNGFEVDVESNRVGDGRWVWYLRDSTTEALFSALISDSLDGTLNLRRTLGRIAELAVPQLGDASAVLLDLRDRFRIVTAGPGSISDDRVVVLEDLDEGQRAAVLAATDGEARIVDDAGVSPLASTHGWDGSRGGIAVCPMRAGRRLIGAVLIRMQLRHRLATVSLRSLAARGALAVAAARDYEERSRLVATLRSALAPPTHSGHRRHGPRRRLPGLRRGG